MSGGDGVLVLAFITDSNYRGKSSNPTQFTGYIVLLGRVCNWP